MNKVVIVAYGFPPVGGAGVQRPVKFVKFLRRFGWEPVVLTVSNPSVPLLDTSMQKDIPADIKIYKARTLEPSYKAKQTFKAAKDTGGGLKALIKKYLSMFLLPDPQILWWPGLVVELIKVIKTEKPACLFVTAPPFSSFIPVAAIGKLFGIPVVLDYRDEWVFSRNTWENSSRASIAFFLDKVMERFVLNNCQAFTTATQSYIESIVTHYGDDLKSKGTVITNGYDADDFVIPVIEPGSNLESNIINIIYAGTVWKATSLDSFCRCLSQFLVLNPSMKKHVRLKVYGRVVAEERACLEDENIKEVTECYGYIEHDKLVAEMFNADILLLTLSDLPGANKIIHGKAFEYMASGRHIFALLPEGEVQKLISEHYGNVTIVHPDDDKAIYQALDYLINNIDVVRNLRGKDVTGFLRENLTAKLAAVYNRVAGN
ncbi:MAG: hypothetical protein A2X85_14335 [Geobacteraceae bacterium GWF2_54_21]|nr:MAG: hypothetical protein A2X85_14335 [Geobacteraceae bacterium GWF2_54_21]